MSTYTTHNPLTPSLSTVEICAGGGGQALGLEWAGFHHAAVVEIDHWACQTLRHNRPHWNVIEADIRNFDPAPYHGVDLLSGGVPCPPFSVAGKQLGSADERDLFPEALSLASVIRPRAILLENVRGLAEPRFAAYRQWITTQLEDLGYLAKWHLMQASDFGVPQRRVRFLLVALRAELASAFSWPAEVTPPKTVGQTLQDLMMARDWAGARDWAARANGLAPTIVGGSKKHGGPDLGPTRARQQWAALGVDGLGIANDAPGADTPPDSHPKLTVRMVARLQGFPDTWAFIGKKTHAYRQVGNAFPPPVAGAVGLALRAALQAPTCAVSLSNLGVRSAPTQPSLFGLLGFANGR